MKNERWVNKYKPKTVKDYLFPAGKEGRKLRNILKEKRPQHLILYGTPGTGKTSFVPVLKNNFGIDDIDTIRFMGDEVNSAGGITKKIFPVIQTCALNSQFRIIHIEEADHFNGKATTVMKGVLEDWPDTYFIMTTNNIDRLDEAILDRCEVVEVKQTRKDIVVHAGKILTAEGLSYDERKLVKLVASLPKTIRKVVNTLEDWPEQVQ